MRRDDRHPFDLEADEAADITQQFWGTSRAWARTDTDDQSDLDRADRTPRSIQALKSGLTGMRPRRPRQPTRRSDNTGRVDRTRVHGVARHAPADGLDVSRREATLAELAAGLLDDDDWPELDLPTTRPPTQSRRRVEPVSRQAVPAASPERQPFDFYPEDLDEVVDDDPDHLVPLSPVAPLAERLGLGAVDPLLARLGAIVLVAVLAIPVALSAREGAPDDVLAESVGVPVAQATATVSASNAALAAGAAPAAAPAPVVATASSQTDDVVQTAAPAAEAAVESPPPEQESAAAATAVDEESATGPAAVAAAVPQSAAPTSAAAPEAATVSEPADRDEPVCTLTYEAGAGDSWYRIADAAGVSPGALMAANGADLDTTIFPGDEICLPEGASMPSQPAPPTTAPPATTQPPTTAAPSTTAKPATTTTVKPTSTTSPPPAPVSTGAVQDLIREIWPDELEEKALQIAYRESNYRSNAYNGSCCYGVFQIHWTSHKSWLDDYGITSTNDLFDARKNITAAYALYQRSGGWGPWGG